HKRRGSMEDNWVLRLPWAGKGAAAGPEKLLTREWLVTNGLGGYATGTIGGAVTRRYHGLLIAALPAPPGRQVRLNHPSELPPLRLHLYGERPAFTLDSRQLRNIFYRVEGARGYEHRGDLWSPGYFRADLSRGHDVTLVASTESWETIDALSPEDAQAAEHER